MTERLCQELTYFQGGFFVEVACFLVLTSVLLFYTSRSADDKIKDYEYKVLVTCLYVLQLIVFINLIS